MAHADQAAQIQITLRDFMMVIFRRKWIILSMVAVTTTVVFFALMMKPIVYTSRAKVLIWGMVRGNQFDRTVMVLENEEMLTSESELFTSKPILESAQAMLDEQAARGERRIKISLDHLRAAPIQKSRILILSYTASHPEDAERVCQAVSTAYTEYHDDLFKQPDLSQFFATELQKANDALVDVLNRRLEVKQGTGVADVGVEVEKSYQMLAAHNVNLAQIDRQIASLRSELAAAAEMQRNGSAEVPFNVTAGEVRGSALISLSNSLSSQLVERERLMTTYTERHPQMLALDSQIAETRQAIAREVAQVTELKQVDIGRLEAERAVLQGNISRIEDRLSVLPLAERDIMELTGNVEVLQRHYQDLVYMNSQAQAGNTSMADYHVSLLSPAGPAEPSNPRDMVRMSLGPVLSLLVGIGLAFFFDNLDHSLKNPEEVERYLGLPVLTSVKRRHARELAL